MRRTSFFYCVLVLGLAARVAALAEQAPPTRAFPPIDPAVRMTSDVVYANDAATALRMDVYRRPGNGRQPALVFFIRAVGAERHQPVYDMWARAAASRGLVAVLPDIRAGHEAEDVDRVHVYLAAHASELAVEADNVAVYAASGNVATALPAVEDPRRSWITAAVMFYGSAEVAEFRREVPLLLVRAGLDRPGINGSIIRLAERALRENVPVTVLNEQTGHHGFDLRDGDAATRAAVAQSLDFVMRATAREYQAALRAGAAEAAAAAHVANGRFAQAAVAYGALAAAHPDDPTLGLAYAEALLGSGQYAAACATFEGLRDKDLGSRDLGLPAAEACLRKGDPAAAVGWLNTIPARFLPPTVADEPRFAPLKDREDFKALFKRQ